MSKIYRDGKVEEEKMPASLRSLNEKGKMMRSSFSLEKDNKNLLCTTECKSKKLKKTESSRRHYGRNENCMEKSDWLRPELSLSTLRELPVKGTKQITVPRSTCSSSVFFQKCDSQIRQSSERLKNLAGIGVGGCLLKNRDQSEEKIRNLFPIEPYETETGESKALKNWEKWMKIRKRQNNFFSEKLKKNKCKLVMNSGENLRQIREEKDMLAYAQIPAADKWRGNPFMWKKSTQLAQRGMQSTYYLTETLSEKGIVPPLEFVSIPDAIKQEKDVYCDNVDNLKKKSGWENSGYRKQKREIYKKELLKIASHAIDEKDLIALGKKILPEIERKRTSSIDVPSIEITPPEKIILKKRSCDDFRSGFGDSREEVRYDPCQDVKSLATLVINGIEFKMEEGETFNGKFADEVCMSWFLTFEKAPIDSVTEAVLYVENKGSLAVRYEWQLWKPDKNFPVFIYRKASSLQQFFFFDKNPGVFLPGQKSEIKFYHHAKYAGYHSETWRLELSPNIFRCVKHGKIKLLAVAEDTVRFSELLKIETYLDELVKETIVRKIVEEIVERIRPEVPNNIEYPSLFMEEELFEFQNPFCHYRYDIVAELKDIFSQISLDPPQEWDFSLSTLEELIRLFVKGNVQYAMLCRVIELSRSLLRPDYQRCRANKKHKMLYNALCRIMDMIEDGALRLRTNFARISFEMKCFDRENMKSNLELEKNFTAVDQAKSERSQVSKDASLDVEDEVKSEGKLNMNKMILDKIDSNEIIYYKHALNTMIFYYLCEAAEQAAGIIETCRIFEHHGEIISNRF